MKGRKKPAKAANCFPVVSIVTVMKKLLPVFIFVALSLPLPFLKAQGYQALHGSAFTGSTAVFNNPAASVHSAYKWDLSLFSLQLKMSSNSPYLKNFSLSNQDSAYLTMRNDVSSKFIHATADLSLFNFLYKIDNRSAFNFGIRLRSYSHIKTLPFHYTDSINSIHSFLIANQNAPYVQGFVTQSSWMEADLNYSQVLIENNNSTLSGGITLQIMKGMAGAFMKLNKVSYLESKTATDTSFTFTNGSGSFGYSANLDETSFKDFYKNSVSALGLSLGVEYMTYNNDINTNHNNLNYDWKIGVSLMDIGANSFKPSIASGQFYNPKGSIADANFDLKVNGASNIKELKDSLSTLFSNSADITENFSITNPTRLIVNVDKNLGNHFYVNGEMSLNFYSTASSTKFHTRELNLVTVTPRWETIGWGAYLPVQYNTQGQLWIGAAIKAGPLVLGFHNLGLLKKDPTLNGGIYLLLSVHPFSKKRVLGKLDCPE